MGGLIESLLEPVSKTASDGAVCYLPYGPDTIWICKRDGKVMMLTEHTEHERPV